jgi:hypothetical protein
VASDGLKTIGGLQIQLLKRIDLMSSLNMLHRVWPMFTYFPVSSELPITAATPCRDCVSMLAFWVVTVFVFRAEDTLNGGDVSPKR